METLALGLARKGRWPVDVRLVRDSGAFLIVQLGTPRGPFATADEARAWCAANFDSVDWRDELACTERESPCPICGAPRFDDARVPGRICPVCVLEAVDESGEPVRYSNTSLGGGFQSNHGVRKASDHRCWVRGHRCWADEAHLGGIVIRIEQ